MLAAAGVAALTAAMAMGLGLGTLLPSVVWLVSGAAAVPMAGVIVMGTGAKVAALAVATATGVGVMLLAVVLPAVVSLAVRVGSGVISGHCELSGAGS